MCGLSGCVGNLAYKEELVAKDLMFYNTLRGEDSTGVATLVKGKGNTPKIAKAIGQPWNLVDTKKYENSMKGSLALIMTHNRKATVGAKSIGNAHPFEYGSITGMHNGTIPDMYIKDLPDFAEMETDSKVIINSIDKWGIKKTIENIPESANLAYALVWYDAKDHSINFMRNPQRSLYFAFDDNRHDLFWSSEIEHLASALNRREIKREDKEKIYGLIPYKHYKWLIPPPNQPFKEAITEELKHKKYVSYSGGGHDHRPFLSANSNQYPEIKPPSAVSRNGPTRTTPTPTATGTSTDATVRKILAIGKNKFPLVYKDDLCRIYYDSDVGEYVRYWWNAKETHYYSGSFPMKPLEIGRSFKDDAEIEDLIKRGATRIGNSVGQTGDGPLTVPKIDKDKELVLHEGRRFIITRNKTKEGKLWNCYIYQPLTKNWVVERTQRPPAMMPDTLYDIKGDHTYAWHGKKAKRNVKYRMGLGHKELTRSEFNNLTHQGCSNCDRVPTWTEGRRGGVKVNFLTDRGEFLCEYCSMDKELLAGLQRLAEEEKNKGQKTLKETIN